MAGLALLRPGDGLLPCPRAHRLPWTQRSILANGSEAECWAWARVTVIHSANTDEALAGTPRECGAGEGSRGLFIPCVPASPLLGAHQALGSAVLAAWRARGCVGPCRRPFLPYVVQHCLGNNGL